MMNIYLFKKIRSHLKKIFALSSIEDSSLVRDKQKMILILLVFFIFLIVISLYFLSGSSKRKIVQVSGKKTESLSIGRKTELDPAEIWVLKAQEKVSDLEKKVDNDFTEFKKLSVSHENLAHQQEESMKMFQLLEDRLTALNQKISDNKINIRNNVDMVQNHTSLRSNFGIQTYRVALRHAPNVMISGKTTKNYVPVGSFVKAILLNGLLAATSVTGQANPRPVLLRILDVGQLPNHAHSRLKDCFVIGAGIGDISSERAYIRLETLSCTRKNNQIIEFPVYGTVVGPDGRDGIYGRMIWADQKLLKNALRAGLVSGLSQGVSQNFVTKTISPTLGWQTLMSDKVLQYGASSAASTASEKLADYYLKRSDQYQPVVEIDAGTLVDIVFLKQGFYLQEPNNSPTKSLTKHYPREMKDDFGILKNQESKATFP